METIFNFSKFHLKKKKEEKRKQMIIENRYLQLLNLRFFLKKKLISNVKKNEKSNTLERNNLEKISNKYKYKYKYPISQNRKEQIL